MYLYMVLARRSVYTGRAAFCPGPRPLYESDPWGQGEKRQDRLPENRRAAPWGHAPAGLCLSRSDAGDPGPPAATYTSDAQTGRIVGAHPEYQQSVQSARDWEEAGLQGQSGRRGGTVS